MASNTTKAGAIDLTMRIALTMRRLGIPGLPRNYELVYEANAGNNPALSRELLALGMSPSQAALDRLGRKYLAHHHGEGIVADAQSRVSSNLEECLRLLREEQGKLEDYGRTLHQASDEMNKADALKIDIIRNFIRILTAATDTTISDSRQTIRTMVERSTEIDKVRTELHQYKRMAHTDVLTQLANRRAFDDMLARVYDDGTGSYFSLVIADIDHFKRINDTFGHPVGDKIIKLVGSLFRAALRRDVFIARTGGEEFAFILAGTTAEETQSIANRIRATVDRTPFVNQRTGADYGPVTLSIGACMAADADNAEDLYRKADAALYASKNAGRNRVTLHSSAANGDLSDARIMYRREPALSA